MKTVSHVDHHFVPIRGAVSNTDAFKYPERVVIPMSQIAMCRRVLNPIDMTDCPLRASLFHVVAIAPQFLADLDG